LRNRLVQKTGLIAFALDLKANITVSSMLRLIALPVKR
jgi:hypothetical protein